MAQAHNWNLLIELLKKRLCCACTCTQAPGMQSRSLLLVLGSGWPWDLLCSILMRLPNSASEMEESSNKGSMARLLGFMDFL